MAGTKRILVIQTAFLGDLLLSVPLLKYLKAQFPHSEISLVCRKGFGSLLKELGLVDQIFEIQKKKKETYQAALQVLKATEFDVLLSPHESFTTALFVRKIRAKMKIGFSRWWNFPFFTERIKKDYSLPDSLRQMSLLQAHDPKLKRQLAEFHKADLEWAKKNEALLTPVPDWASPKVSSQSHGQDVLSRFSLPSKYVCLFPGSVWKTKQWTEEGFTEVGKKLSEEGSFVVLMGAPGEEELAERISSQVPNSISLAGKTTLSESLAVLSKAQIVITNDSAGQHLASLVQAPTVAVFGPTVLPFGYRPWNSQSIVVERKGLGCRPCGKHGHHQCPIGTHECMKSIQAQEVLAATRVLMRTN